MRRPITLALSLLGLFVSLYLLYTYTSPSRPMVCIGTGCDAVRASAYSTLGGVSMPVFGVAGYILLAIVGELLGRLRTLFLWEIGRTKIRRTEVRPMFKRRAISELLIPARCS